jgi:hypothetical protein
LGSCTWSPPLLGCPKPGQPNIQPFIRTNHLTILNAPKMCLYNPCFQLAKVQYLDDFN